MFNCEVPTNFTPRGAQTINNNCSEEKWLAEVANKSVLGAGGNKKQDVGWLKTDMETTQEGPHNLKK